MPSSASKSVRTKNFIIESTAEVFNKKGYAGTSLTDLTLATGLTKGSIYGNFDNKEEVALAVFDHNLLVMTAQVEVEVSNAVTIVKKLLAYPRAYRKIMKTVLRHGGCPILNTATESDDTNPKLRNKAAAAIQQWEQALVMLIEAGIKAGEIRKDILPSQLAVAIISLIEGGIMISKVTGDLRRMTQALNTAEDLIRQAATARKKAL